MSEKARLSATVDGDLLAAGKAAVAAGDAVTLSAWVNDALRRKADEDRRQRALGEFVAEYEAEFGEITEEELEANRREMRARAIVVRGRDARS